MGIQDRDYMRRRREKDSERASGAAADERVGLWLVGLMRRHPQLPRRVLIMVAALIVAGVVVAMLSK